uniref:Uncharacterized protein n=1 Tax=Anguilla anguilla TaxID=7936 RepID=A0A0E9UT68_ANGAN
MFCAYESCVCIRCWEYTVVKYVKTTAGRNWNESYY